MVTGTFTQRRHSASIGVSRCSETLGLGMRAALIIFSKRQRPGDRGTTRPAYPCYDASSQGGHPMPVGRTNRRDLKLSTEWQKEAEAEAVQSDPQEPGRAADDLGQDA